MPPSHQQPSPKPVTPPLSKEEIMRRLKSLPKHQLAEILDNLKRMRNLE